MDIARTLTNQIIAPDYYFKEILTIKDATEYLGVSIGCIYRYVADSKIPCYKPNCKSGNVYFMKSELDTFMLRNKKCADYEVSSEAESKLNGEAK